MKSKSIVLFVLCVILSASCYLIAESRAEIFTEEEVVFVDEEKDVITLSLGRYDGGEGVITSPDQSVKGLPYVIGAMKYGYGQPYIFPLNDSLSQTVLIPYTLGSGTGVAERVWCIAISKNKNVYIEHLGTWHYHCCGPRDDFFSFDILPSFKGTLSFLYEERREGEVEFIKGDVALKIIVGEDGCKTTLEPCSIEDALKIADLLTKHGCINEWAIECLNNIFPDEMKQLKPYKDKIPLKAVDGLKKNIKQYYDKQNGK